MDYAGAVKYVCTKTPIPDVIEPPGASSTSLLGATLSGLREQGYGTQGRPTPLGCGLPWAILFYLFEVTTTVAANCAPGRRGHRTTLGSRVLATAPATCGAEYTWKFPVEGTTKRNPVHS